MARCVTEPTHIPVLSAPPAPSKVRPRAQPASGSQLAVAAAVCETAAEAALSNLQAQLNDKAAKLYRAEQNLLTTRAQIARRECELRRRQQALSEQHAQCLAEANGRAQVSEALRASLQDEVERLRAELDRCVGVPCSFDDIDDVAQIEQIEANMLDGLRALLLKKEQLREVSRSQQESRTQCIVCMDAAREVLFTPCGHVVCCEACAERVPNCPSCRAVVCKNVRAYL